MCGTAWQLFCPRFWWACFWGGEIFYAVCWESQNRRGVVGCVTLIWLAKNQQYKSDIYVKLWPCLSSSLKRSRVVEHISVSTPWIPYRCSFQPEREIKTGRDERQKNDKYGEGIKVRMKRRKWNIRPQIICHKVFLLEKSTKHHLTVTRHKSEGKKLQGLRH